MAELEFSFDISGHDAISTDLRSITGLVATPEIHIYTQNSGPLTFSFDIAGHYGETTNLYHSTQLEASHRRDIVIRADIQSRTFLEGKRKWNIGHSANIHSVTFLEGSHLLNIGYVDDVYFGSVLIPHARYDEIDRITFPFREKTLYGGYRSIRSKNVRGYSGAIKFVTDDWNDIQALIDKIGTPCTLRLWGKPYRNVYLEPDIEIETIKKKFNRWNVRVKFKQDSAIPGISS